MKYPCYAYTLLLFLLFSCSFDHCNRTSLFCSFAQTKNFKVRNIWGGNASPCLRLNPPMDAAQVLASSPKDVLKSTVFICCRKAASDCSSLTKDGREFHARAPAAGNARSLRVRRRVAGTISVDVTADCRRLQELRLVVKCKVSAMYCGAVS